METRRWRSVPSQGFIFCLGHDLTPHLLIRGRGAVRIHFKDVIGVKSISRTDGRKKAAGLEVSEGPSEFLSEFLLTPRIRPSQLRGDGGMAVLAALMASRRGRTRWGRAAGLRAPRCGARAGR